MSAVLCPGCGGRNPANVATCAFCQHPLGPVRGRPSGLAGRWPWLRVTLVVVVLLLIGVLLALASRATPLLPVAT